MEYQDYDIVFMIVPTGYEHNSNDAEALIKTLDSLFPCLRDETLLACYGSNACLNMGQIVYDKFLQFMNYQKSFDTLVGFGADEITLQEYLNNEFFTSKGNSFCKFSTKYPQAFVQSLNISTENKGSVLIIAENNIFKELEKHNFARNFGPFKYGKFKPLSEDEISNMVSKNADWDDESTCEYLQGYLRKKPLSKLFEQKLRVLDDTNSNLDLFKSRLEIIEKAVRHLSFNSNSSVNISESLLSKFEKEAKTAEEQIEACTKIINHAVDIKKTFSDPGTKKNPDSFLQIKKFYYNNKLENFKLQVENSTDFDFYNVTVFILETGDKLCDFSLIENQTKVWKETDVPYKGDLYGSHLIAVSQNEIALKEPYFISKCKLKVLERGEEKVHEEYYPKRAEMVFTVEVKNYSMDPVKELLLNIPESVVGLKFTSTHIDYSEMTQNQFEEQKFEDGDQLDYDQSYKLTFKANYNFDDTFKSLSENYKIFVCWEKAIVSNTILLNYVKDIDNQ